MGAKKLSVRVLVVVGLAALSGLAAWAATKGETPIYERQISFLVVPDKKFGSTQVPSNVDSTLAGGIGSTFMLDQSLRRLGVNPALAKAYSLQAFVRPGSDFIDASLRGPNPRFLTSLGTEFIGTSKRWSARQYEAYDLNFLETTATPQPVSPRPKRTLGLGVLVGGLLGLLLLFGESQLSARRRQEHGRVVDVGESEELPDQDELPASPSAATDEPVRGPVRELAARDARNGQGGATARRRRRRAGGQGH